jgi:hypothetical protein
MTTIPSTNLREFPRRAGIVIDLDYLRDLMREYCNEKDGDEDSVGRRLYLSGFLEWVRRRQKETTNEPTKRT